MANKTVHAPWRWFGSAMLAGAALLSACGGNSSAPSLSGVAAVGLPIVAGTVTVSCAGGGALSTTTSSSGGWRVTTSGQSLPCAVQVSGGTVGGAANSTPYHSIALGFGTVNVTPLTDLAVANLLGSAPATWFSSPTFTSVNSSTLDAALGTVRTQLGLGTALGSTNPFTAVFAAQAGDRQDAILEAIKTTLTNLGSDYATLLNAALNNSFATNFATFGTSFGTVYVAPSGGGSSGGGGSTTGATSCGTGETLLVFSVNNSVSSAYSNGQGVCFTASTTALGFSGKTLTNPVQNTAVTSPNSAYKFTDTSNSYEYDVVFISGTLHEINLTVPTAQFAGQFAPSSGTGTGTGTGTAGSLTIVTTVAGIAGPAVVVSPVTPPTSQSDFCSSIQSDSSITSLTASGGTLTINSCSYSGNVGTINATVAITTPVNFSTSYSISYTYN